MINCPGVVSRDPNEYVITMKDAVWADVLRLLGKEGDRIMRDMLLHCGVFKALDGGRNNFYQVCGWYPSLRCFDNH